MWSNCWAVFGKQTSDKILLALSYCMSSIVLGEIVWGSCLPPWLRRPLGLSPRGKPPWPLSAKTPALPKALHTDSSRRAQIRLFACRTSYFRYAPNGQPPRPTISLTNDALRHGNQCSEFGQDSTQIVDPIIEVLAFVCKSQVLPNIHFC